MYVHNHVCKILNVSMHECIVRSVVSACTHWQFGKQKLSGQWHYSISSFLGPSIYKRDEAKEACTIDWAMPAAVYASNAEGLRFRALL